MKKILIFILLTFVSFLSFAKTSWLDVSEEQKEKGVTAIAMCTTKEETLKIAHIENLEPYFKYYTNYETKNNNDFSIYLVLFSTLGMNIMEFQPHSNAVAVYIKTIFE